MEDDFDAFVYLPGNGYSSKDSSKFLRYLSSVSGKPVIFVQLKENINKSLSYKELSPESYSQYIAHKIGKFGKYVMIGISMGCLHIANFAHFYPSWCYKCMIMLEPTIAQGIYPFLHEFESGRGNDEWLEGLKEDPNEQPIPSNEKVIDMSLDKVNNIPSNINIGVVFTSRNNENRPYTTAQIHAKNQYYKWLSRNHKTYLLHLNTWHCVDTQPQYFEQLTDFILKVIKTASD